jgi:hypothetical protein
MLSSVSNTAKKNPKKQTNEHKNLSTKNSIISKLPKNEGETFPEKQKLKEFVTRRLTLQEMLKGVF